MTCPNCQKPASAAHFRENPECAKAASSVCAMFSASKKTTFTPGPGRPKKVKQEPRNV